MGTDLQALCPEKKGEASLSKPLILHVELCQLVDVANIELFLLNLQIEILWTAIREWDIPSVDWTTHQKIEHTPHLAILVSVTTGYVAVV